MGVRVGMGVGRCSVGMMGGLSGEGHCGRRIGGWGGHTRQGWECFELSGAACCTASSHVLNDRVERSWPWLHRRIENETSLGKDTW